MDKNTLLAFILIAITMSFFFSKTYWRLIGKEYPWQQQTNSVVENDSLTEKESITNNKIISNQQSDTLKYNTIEKTEQEERKIDTIWVENEKLRCGISTFGARIISIKMKNYKYSTKSDSKEDSLNNNIELIPLSSNGGANLEINNINFDNLYFENKNKNNLFNIKARDVCSLIFVSNIQNDTIEKKFIFTGNTFTIGYEISSNTLAGKYVGVGWKCGIAESEKIKGGKLTGGQYLNRRVHFSDAKNIEHLEMKKQDIEERTGFYRWIAISSKYFTIAIVSDSVRDSDIKIESRLDSSEIGNKEEEEKHKKFNYQVYLKSNCENKTQRYWIYAGPNKIEELSKYKIKLEGILFGVIWSGWRYFLWLDIWFPALCEWVLWLLIYLQKVVKDYGLAIIILTILSRIVTYPMTKSSMKSMAGLKEIQPKIQAIRNKYKTNPQKMNEEIMALYKQHGINPFNPGGCLPMFLQMPILFSLFIVIQKAIELRGASTILIPWIKDLSQPEALFEIPTIPLIGNFYGNNFAVLPIVMAFLTYITNKATMKDPNQKAMVYIMPVFMLVLFNSFPSGLVLYWTFSQLLQLVQQYILDKEQNKKRLVEKNSASSNTKTVKK